MPAEILTDYFNRTEVEMVFKTSREYLGLLPIAKWTDLTVRRGMLHDIIDTIILLLLRQTINAHGVSNTERIGKLQSLMCFRDENGNVTVETPSKQVKEYYALFHTKVPARVKTEDFKKDILML